MILDAWRAMRPGTRVVVGAVVVVMGLNLYGTVIALQKLLRFAFFLAIAFVLYLLWRERREEIEAWPGRAKIAFYGAAGLVALDLIFFGFRGASGWGAVAFVLVLVLCIYAMIRVWREQRTYGY